MLWPQTAPEYLGRLAWVAALFKRRLPARNAQYPTVLLDNYVATPLPCCGQRCVSLWAKCTCASSGFWLPPPGQKVLLLAKASSPRTRKSKSVSVSKKTPAATLPSDVHPHINQQLSSINATLSSSLKKCCFLKWLRGLAWNQASVIHVNHEFSKFSHAANWDRAGHFIPSMQATHSKLSGKARQDDFVVWKNYWQDEQWKMSMGQ